CTWSLDTARKNVGYFPDVRVVLVADPEMNAIPARAMGPPTASTSWLPAGPTTATMLEFEMNCWVTVVACAGCSCVSPWTIVILVLLAALSASRASCAKCSCSVPRTATGPVIGPSNPIDAVHDLVLAPVPPVDPPLAALLLLLLLQPATASEPTAAMARTRRPFIGYASIPGLCHEVDDEVEVGVLPRHADGRNATGSAVCRILRRSATSAQTQYALP